MVLVLWRKGASKVNGGSGKLVARLAEDQRHWSYAVSQRLIRSWREDCRGPGGKGCPRQMKWDDILKCFMQGGNRGHAHHVWPNTQGNPGHYERSAGRLAC